MKRGHTAKSQPRSKDRARFIPVHGLRNTLTGSSWSAVMSRCFNHECNSYRHYGAKGITACQFISESPANLISVIGERPSCEFSIDRYPDNKGHYSCGKCTQCLESGWLLNVRWATVTEQGNNRVDNRVVTIRGRTQTATEWADELGIKRSSFYRRLNHGWSGDRLAYRTRKAQTVTINGETKTIYEWIEKIGICEEAFRKRLRRGVPDHLLTLPAQKPRAFVNAV